MNKIAIYTAIIGNYDDLPEVDRVEADIDYICFSDEDMEPKYPWTIVTFKRVFADPQREARRIKLLPHLFLPDYRASLWVDATVRIVNCPSSYIWESTSKYPIACARHAERDCLYDEAEAVLGYAVDDPGIVRMQMQKYANLGVPRAVGLHVTTFLMRRHTAQNCINFSYLWWNELSTQSKRDQLSFDFVRWLLRQKINEVPYLMEQGEILGWGERSFWHKAGSDARKNFRPVWPFPNLNVTLDRIYHEHEISPAFLHAAQSFLADYPQDFTEKLPLPYSNSAAERSALAQILATSQAPLFWGSISPLWILWSLGIAPGGTKISWVLGDLSCHLEKIKSELVKFSGGDEIKCLPLTTGDLLKNNANRWLSKFDLIVLCAETVPQELHESLVASLNSKTRIMIMHNSDEFTSPIDSNKYQLAQLSHLHPVIVYEKK